MRTRYWVVAVLFLTGCQQGTKEEAPAPKPQAAQPAPQKKLISITSKSPAAIETFKHGRAIFEAGHTAEAIADFKKALAADPGFALALAYLGDATPGAEGDKLLAQAAAAAAALPEAERLYIEQKVAQRKTDTARAKATLERIVALAPDDWRPYWDLGMLAFNAGDLDGAVAQLKKATTVDPTGAAEAYDSLAIVCLEAGRPDEAMANGKRYTELMPKEANSWDTYGETFIRANRLAEAEAQFKKANELSPTLTFPWTGLMTAQAGRGEYAAALATAAKAKEAMTLPRDKLQFDVWAGWIKLLDNKTAEGMKILAGVEKEVAAKKLPFGMALTRGRSTAAYLLGKYADAVKYGKEYAAWTKWPELGPSAQQFYKRVSLFMVGYSQARTGKVKDAEKTLALFEAARKEPPQSGWLEGWAAQGQGAVAWAKGDLKAAVAAMQRCNKGDWFCDYDRWLLQEKLGDKATAEATRKAVLDTWQRDPTYLFVRQLITKSAAKTAKK